MQRERYWSRFADDFEEQVTYIVGNHDMEIIKRRISEQRDLGKTLELGCGSGIYSVILADKAEHLTATDLSDAMIAATKRRLGARENVHIEQANCFDLSYPDSTFDTVFMANLLHVIPEPEKAIAEARRVLTKNGRLIVMSFTTDGMTFLNKLAMIYRYLKTWGTPPPKRCILTVQKVRSMGEERGFHIEEATLLGNQSKAVFLTAIATGTDG